MVAKRIAEKCVTSLFEKNASNTLADLRPLQSTSSPETSSSDNVTSGADTNYAAPGVYSCQRCPAVQLETRDELCEHWRSGWHLLNLKRSLKRRPPLTEHEYDELPSDDENLYADSSSDDSCGSAADDNRSPNQPPVQRYTQSSPLAYFVNANNRVIGVYKCLVNNGRLPDRHTSNNTVILMLAGGHFAGAVFECGRLAAHKTFHRYTVRAKQGGAQTARDGAQQKAPRSAGATLRRYNAQALVEEVSELLQSWRHSLAVADYIFIRCPTYSRYLFVGAESGGGLTKDDRRVRNIPMITKRPTVDELKRVFQTLTGIYDCGTVGDFEQHCTELSERRRQMRQSKAATRKSTKLMNELAEMELDSSSSEDEGVAAPTVEKQTDSVDEPSVADPDCLSAQMQQTVYTAVRKDDVDQLQAMLSKDLADLVQHHLMFHRLNLTEQTLLHVAATFGCHKAITFLLQLGTDPAAKDSDGKVPFQVCADNKTRLVFSQYRLSQSQTEGEDNVAYWNKAQVPLPPTPEQEAAAREKEAKKRKAKKQRDKAKRAEQAVEREEKRTQDRFLALSDREKRALAAERRLREMESEQNTQCTVVASRCFNCGKDLSGRVPFEYSDNRFCTVTCVKAHRAANS